MKKSSLVTLLLLATFQLAAVVPGYFGARSLALGYASLAYNYDVNAIYSNPALLALLPFSSLSGYQYQYSYLDYSGFDSRLAEIRDHDLAHFVDLAEAEKTELINELREVFAFKTGGYGFSSHRPGYVGRGFGIAVAVVNAGLIFPEASDILAKPVADITNDDIAALRLNLIGFKYSQYSLSYALPLSKTINVGLTVHYLKGKVGNWQTPVNDDSLQGMTDIKDYLQYAWSDPQDNLSKLNLDIGLSTNITQYLRLGLVARNLFSPNLGSSENELRLERRVIAGLAFQPNAEWGIYLDMDIAKTDLYYSGHKSQPVSLGVEKGFFKNKLFVRAGFVNDITEKNFFGSQSNMLYGVGMGFNVATFFIDLALGLNHDGRIKNLAISGFFQFGDKSRKN